MEEIGIVNLSDKEINEFFDCGNVMFGKNFSVFLYKLKLWIIYFVVEYLKV